MLVLYITKWCFPNNFIIYRIHSIKKIEKFFKFIFSVYTMLKLLTLLFSWIKLDSSIWTLSLVHIVTQQIYTNLSKRWVQNLNHLVSQIELFIHVQVFGHFCYQHYEQVSMSIEILSCNDKLILQLQELFEIRFSGCEILYQPDVFFLSIFRNLWVLHPSNGHKFWTKKPSKSVLTVTRVTIFVSS